MLTHKEELDICGDIDYACEYNDHKHFDFSFTNGSGKQIYIEVKATSANKKEVVSFEMSDKEYDFMLSHLDSYFVCYINDVFNGKIIKKIPAHLISGVPSKYKVLFGDSNEK